jgi:excisionase family DNA binding protein
LTPVDDSSADPVAWVMIEPGWDVVDSAGEKAGTIAEVTGDSSTDIFNGLAIDTGLLARPRYVPSELVGRIVEGRVHLTVTKDELGRLGEFKEPPESAELSAESAGFVTRDVGAGAVLPAALAADRSVVPGRLEGLGVDWPAPLTVRELSAELGCSEDEVRALIRNGELRTVACGIRPGLVPRHEFDAYVRRHPHRLGDSHRSSIDS